MLLSNDTSILAETFIRSRVCRHNLIDESHVTCPQLRAMYNGDQARKKVLIDHGFRLPSAADNRPLKDIEFWNKAKQNSSKFISMHFVFFQLSWESRNEPSCVKCP